MLNSKMSTTYNFMPFSGIMQNINMTELVTVHYVVIYEYHFITEDKLYPIYFKINLS